MKDNFSKQASAYATFRPGYPAELFEYIAAQATGHDAAWDVATGNGQFAAALAPYFKNIMATDISANQLKNAAQKPNITYREEPAEHTGFADQEFDLITVAQAIHWFDFDAFYTEVNRVLRPGGLFVVAGYGLFSADAKTDKIMRHFYDNIVGDYWDKERRYLDELYQTLPVPPFTEMPVPAFTNRYQWTYDHYIGYLDTWSAVQHYKDKNGANPVDLVAADLKACWKAGEQKTISFPVLFRMWKK